MMFAARITIIYRIVRAVAIAGLSTIRFQLQQTQLYSTDRYTLLLRGDDPLFMRCHTRDRRGLKSCKQSVGAPAGHNSGDGMMVILLRIIPGMMLMVQGLGNYDLTIYRKYLAGCDHQQSEDNTAPPTDPKTF